jgi:predicted RNA-binding protein with PIN domain
MTEPTLYLFDGYNLLHAGTFRDGNELIDRLADFVALKGARGVVVFDGGGDERDVGRLEVRYAPDADAMLERIAAEQRHVEQVCLVSSDAAVRGTTGQEVQKRSSSGFLSDLVPAHYEETTSSRVGDRVDAETRAALERLRRGDKKQPEP